MIGINLYEILKHMPEYAFTELCIIEMKHKYGYDVFQVKRSAGAAD